MNKVNTSIKSLFIILILNTYYISSIYSTEIIITVPDQYNSNEMPLPPFPEEVVNELNVNEFDSEIKSIKDARWIKQKYIDYNYYTDFLNLAPPAKGYVSSTFSIYRDSSNVELTVTPEYKSNSFKLTGAAKYSIDTGIFNMDAEYREFRAPINIIIGADYNNSTYSFLAGNIDYYNKWYLNPVFKETTTEYNILFIDKRYIRPFVQLYYSTEKDHYGAAALGANFSYGNFRGGTSIIDRTILPYGEFYFKNGSFITNGETEVEQDYVSYLIEAGYKKETYFKAGGGIDMYTDYEYIPFLSFKENLFFGQREYKIYQDKLYFDLSYYKGSFLSKISFGIEQIKNVSLSIEAGIYDVFNIQSSLLYNSEVNDYFWDLRFEYKVGNL